MWNLLSLGKDHLNLDSMTLNKIKNVPIHLTNTMMNNILRSLFKTAQQIIQVYWMICSNDRTEGNYIHSQVLHLT
jgi:hypothetical protein